MLIFMSHYEYEQSEQTRRWRQVILIAAALLGLCFITLAIVTAGAASAQAAARLANLTAEDKATLDEVSTYLESLGDLQGRFMQVASDGATTEGKFYLRRPGRMRFEYTPPTNMLVVADGTWVVVKDGFSAAQRYPLGSTPLGILLRDKVDLAKNVDVIRVAHEPGTLMVTLADRSGEAPGELTLVFDKPALALKQWIVTDAQGLRTVVALQEIQAGIKADNALFVVKDDQRPEIGKR